MSGLIWTNPILFRYWGIQPYFMYNSGGNNSAHRARQTECAASAATRSLYPYSISSNWGGRYQVNALDADLPLNMVMDIQMMQANPYYMPQCPTRIDATQAQRAIADAWARGQAEAQKIGLGISFRSLKRSITSLKSELSELLKTEGIPAEEKAKLEAVQQKLIAFEQEVEQYAANSADKDVQTAVAEVEAMKGKLQTIKTEAINIAKQMQAVSQQTEDPGQETTSEQPVPTEQQVPPEEATVPSPPGVPHSAGELPDPDDEVNPVFDEDGKFKLDNENLTLEEVKNTYNEYRKQLNEFLKTKGLSNDDKQKIINKCKELVKAIHENKPAVDAAKLYNELIDIVNQAATNINNQANKTNLDEIKKAYSEVLKPMVDNMLNDPDITPEDKKAILAKCQELVDAIHANKPAEDVAKIYNEIVELLEKSQAKISETKTANAAKICSDLYTAANGFDWSWFGESKNEKDLKNIVKNKINKYNIIEVMKQWENGDYNSRTGDQNMLETLYGEFQYNTSGIKTDLTNHLLKCFEEVAKDMGLHNAIMPYVSAIRGEMNCTCWSYEKIYNAFDSILAILGCKKIAGESTAQQQTATPQTEQQQQQQPA